MVAWPSPFLLEEGCPRIRTCSYGTKCNAELAAGVRVLPRSAFRWIWRKFESKKDQTPLDLCADFGEACVAGSGRFRGNVG